MKHRYTLPFAFLVLAWSHTAFAENGAIGFERRTGKIVEYLVDGAAGAYDIELHADVITILHFDEPIEYKNSSPKGAIHTELSKVSAKTLLVGPLASASRNLKGSIRVATGTREYNLKVSMAHKATDAVYVGMFRERTEVGERAKLSDRARTLEIAKAVLEPREIYPAGGKMHASGDRLALRIERGYWIEEQLFVTFEVENQGSEPRALAEVLVFDKDGQRRELDVVHVQSFGSTEPGLVAMIPPNQRARGVVSVPDAANGAFTSMRMELVEPRGLRAVWAAVDEWANSPFVRPKTPEEIEQERREKERRAQELAAWEREQAAVGRRTLYAKGMLGAIWLAKSMPGDSMPEGGVQAAFLSGYGARLTYGFTSFLDLETELVYAKSGTVSFENVDRSASLMRLQFGGLLRFGKTYMPTIRAGLGLLGASQRRKVAQMPEESDIQVDLSITGGVGLDIRLSEGWVIGGGLSLDSPLNIDTRTLEFAVHLGYGWRPTP